MPLSTDEAVNATAKDIVSTLHTVFGKHPGYRPAHARGLMLTGTFHPTSEAATLTTAPHFTKPSTPITARFSSSTGIPNIPDTDPNANPRGLALRFNLGTDTKGHRVHTDIISHSVNAFPVQNGEDFLKFFQAVLGGKVEEFLGGHPAAVKFVSTPKPFPVSLETQTYFGLNAFKFTSQEGKEQYFRYRIVPDAGEHFLRDEEVEAKGAGYLWEDLLGKIKSGRSVSFSLVAQLAEDGDQTDDVTVHWPDSRKMVKLGTATLDAIVEGNEKEEKKTIFDPIPRGVSGLEASNDPLLEMRATVYLMSGRERRAAPDA